MLEARGDGLVSVPSLAPAASALLFGSPSIQKKEDDGEEEQRCPPSKEAGHWFSCEWCVIDRRECDPVDFRSIAQMASLQRAARNTVFTVYANFKCARPSAFCRGNGRAMISRSTHPRHPMPVSIPDP